MKILQKLPASYFKVENKNGVFYIGLDSPSAACLKEGDILPDENETLIKEYGMFHAEEWLPDEPEGNLCAEEWLQWGKILWEIIWKRGIDSGDFSEWAAVLSAYDKAIELDPNLLITYFEIGRHYAAYDWYYENIDWVKFTETLNKYPDDGRCHIERGIVDWFTENIEGWFHERGLEALIKRADFYFMTGKYKNAISDYQRLLEREHLEFDDEYDRTPDIFGPNKWVAIQNCLGQAMQKTGGFGEGITAYYINFQGNNHLLCHEERAKAYVQDGEFEKADDDYNYLYENQLSYNDKDGMFRVRLTQAGTYFGYKFYEHAITWYNEALDIDYHQNISCNNKLPDPADLAEEWEEHEWDRNLPEDWPITPEEYVQKRTKEMKEELVDAFDTFVSSHIEIHLHRGIAYYELCGEFSSIVDIAKDYQKHLDWCLKAKSDFKKISNREWLEKAIKRETHYRESKDIYDSQQQPPKEVV